MVDTLATLAADLARTPATVTRRARGVTARHGVDAAVAAVDGLGPDDNLRGRMSRSDKTTGYMFADGWSAVAKERGTSTTPPTSPMARAAQGVAGSWADELAEMAVDVLK